MSQSGIRHLPVVTGDHRLLGILSDRDVLKCCSWATPTGNGRDADNDPKLQIQVQELMSSEPVTIDPDAPLQEAAAILATRRIGCLLVVEAHNRLRGIVSTIDLLLCLASEDDEFEFFAPRSDSHRASFDSTGTLVISRGAADGIEVDQPLFAILGYSRSTSRIAVRLLDDTQASAGGAHVVSVTQHDIKIRAREFVEHFGIRLTDVFHVETDDLRDLLVLTPKRSLHRYSS